jgi:hypothetical protein
MNAPKETNFEMYPESAVVQPVLQRSVSAATLVTQCDQQFQQAMGQGKQKAREVGEGRGQNSFGHGVAGMRSLLGAVPVKDRCARLM